MSESPSERTPWPASLALLALALLVVPALAVVFQPVGWAPKIVVAALLVLTAVRPQAGLLVLAAVGPIATSLFVEIRTGTNLVRFGEALTVAFLCGWCVRRAVTRTWVRIPPPIAWCAAALSVAAIASAAVTLVTSVSEEATTPVREVLARILIREYPSSAHPITAAFLFIESVLLFVIVTAEAKEARERGRLLAMLVTGAAAAALVDLVRLAMAAARTGRGLGGFLAVLANSRVAVNIIDVNAAGSYFVLMLFAAFAVRQRRALVAVCVPLIAMGLWTSGSRTALATALLCAVGYGIAGVWRRLPRRAAALAIVAILIFAAAVPFAVSRVYPERRNMTAGGAFGWRAQMARAALRVTAEHPLFGVGLGSFYEASARYAEARENAHNNYLQVLAELGIVGLALFLATLAAVVLSPKDPVQHLPALSLGVVGFLITCIAGHPLIVGGAAYPFWMALGVSASTIARVRGAAAIRAVAMALLLLIACTLPVRIVRAARTADRSAASAGFSPHWQRDAEGVRYRWAGGRAVFFVESGIRAVGIPLRAGSALPRLEVRVLIDGREANRVTVQAGDEWRTVRLMLLPGGASYHRIELEVREPGAPAPATIAPSDTGGAVMVGREEIVR